MPRGQVCLLVQVAALPTAARAGAGSNPSNPAIPGSGAQTLVWTNVGDIQPGSTNGVSFQVQPAAEPTTPAAQALLPGESFALTANVYTSTDPRSVPTFDSYDNIVASSVSDSAQATGDVAISSFAVTTTEPSPESELMRGVSDHPTTYTVTLTNNAVFATSDITLTQYLPAGLEFLGCGGVDNTTVAPTNPGSNLEYPGAPPLTSIAALGSTCITPTSVDTELVTPPGATSAAVCTIVTWSNLTSLAAGATYTMQYNAGIPMRENSTTFTTATGTPDPTSLAQTANLDNNSGPLTTQGEALTTISTASGTYAGTLGGGAANPVWANASRTVHAEDLAIQLGVSDGNFSQGAQRTYTMHVETSQYRHADDVEVTDTLDNGQCPLGSSNYTLDDETQCAPSSSGDASPASRSTTATTTGCASRPSPRPPARISG